MNRFVPGFFLFLVFIFSLSVLVYGCSEGTGYQDVNPGDKKEIDINKVFTLAISSPYSALALIDSAEAEGSLSSFMAQLTRAKIYFNPLQEDALVIKCAKDALSMDSDELDKHNRIVLLRLLGNSYYLSGQYDECLKTAIEGEKAAQSLDSLGAMGEFKFLTGECQMRLGQYAPAYANMEYGIAALSKESGCHAKETLSHLLGEQMSFMIEDGKYLEAIEKGLVRETLLNRLAQDHGCSNYLDQQFGYHYGKMAYLFMKVGDRQKAGEYADKFRDTGYSRDPIGKLRILEYCLESGRYQEALDIFGKEDFPCSGDSVSCDGEYYLRLKAEACNGLGEGGKGYSYLKRALVISDSLARRTDKERALRISDTYRAHEAELRASEAETKGARYILYMIIFLAICIIMTLGFSFYYIKTRDIIDKNRLIEMGRSDTEKYMRLLQSANARIRELDPKESIQDKSSETDSWQLYLKLEDAMDKEKLYLDKNLTRADILDLLGIGKNRLGKMFQDIGGDLSLPSYINGKRLNHALWVIAEHPEYTVNEIADASGFSNTRNFHLLFKKRFGITPLQYRNGK
jgi:AraC-like DNA-binding protein